MMFQDTSVNPDESTFLCSYGKVRRYGTTTPTQPSPVSAQSFVIYEVKSTDTLQGIALRHNCTVTSIARANKLWSHEALFLKDFIRIPVALDANTPNKTTIERLPPSSKYVQSTDDKTVQDILKRIDRDIQQSSKSMKERDDFKFSFND